MKNREKYPNTDDALKAYNEHKAKCKCDCTLSDWLDTDEDELRAKVRSSISMSIAGMLAGTMLKAAIDADLKKDEPKKDAPSDDGKEKPEETGDIECPICHGKRGRIRNRIFIPDFHCPDCDAVITIKRYIFNPFKIETLAEFKAWFTKHNAAAKKD